MRYFDTSVIFSLYINEARTLKVDVELRNRNRNRKNPGTGERVKSCYLLKSCQEIYK